ncbi:MAG: C25 family peptidase propeptide domain-containing protein, partial [Candidatus Cloacimonadota bacterium]|nr:C25 family peptidase propeptide domain-containing protein [Candidatus Cloacimonadota bacterium]
MKKLSFIFIFILLFGVCFASEEQVVKYDNSWSRAGFSLENSSNFGVGVNFSIEEFTLQNITINSEQLQNIILPGVMLPNNEGAPNLPSISRYIALPEGANAELEIVSTRIETFRGIELAPAPRIPKENDNSPLHYEKDLNIYSRDAFYPANPIQISEVKQIRGVDVSLLA